MNITRLQYISPSVANGCYMSLNYYPKDTTRIVFDYLYFPIQGRGHFAALLAARERNFRFCSFMDSNSYVLSYKGYQQLPQGFTLDGAVEVGNYYIKLNGQTVYSNTARGSFTSDTYLTLGADGPTGNDTLDNINTKIGRFCIYEGDTLVAEFIPALDENDVAGLYNATSDTFFYSSEDPWVDGPLALSIDAIPSKSSLASTGETISIDVECENAWTVTGNTFLTLSSTGDTGSTTITATAPSYSSTIDRTDTLTFTDTVTGDEVVINIKQKKYVSGQPFYLGYNEVTEVYLGDNAINEAYLGDILVFSTGPFVGLKVTPKTVNFAAATLSATIRIKSSEAWSMTLPAWISASQTTGDTGTTSVTLTATPQTGDTADTITVSTANFSASATANYMIYEQLSYVYATSHSSYVQANHIDTGIAHTASTMTVEIEYYGLGGNCDRMVGYSQGDDGCTSDSNDFRLFGFSNGTYDYLSNRQSTGTINTGYRHLTIGDCFCYDNAEERYRAQRTAFETVPSPNCHILVDVSYIKVKSVKIMNGNTLLFDGVAAKVGNDIGIFDRVSGQLKYNSNVPMSYDE